MEALGVVLGAVPIALYALDNYHRCLRPFRDYLKYEDTIAEIRSHVFLAQKNMDVTFGKIGLVNPTRQQLEDRLRDRYPLEYEEFLKIVDRMENIVSGLLEKLQVDSTGKPKWTHDPQESIRWKWRHVRRSFGRHERERLIEELHYWNTGLANILEKPEISSGESEPLVEQAKIIFNPKRCDAIRKHANTIYSTLMKTWGCNCEGHNAKLQLHWDNETPQTPIVFELILQTLNHHYQWCQVSFKIEDEPMSKPLSAGPGQQSPLPAQQSLALSWKKILNFRENRQRSPSRSRVTTSIDANSRNTTHDTMPVSCLCSYVRDVQTAQTGSISPIGQTGIYITLNAKPFDQERLITVKMASVLSDQSTLFLSTRQRYSIAAAAAWGLLFLSGSPWITSEEWKGKEELQLFIEERDSSKLLANDYPTISCYFRSMTNEPANPPDAAILLPRPATLGDQGYQSSPIRNKMLFGLGIFLIEICLNKKFEDLRQEIQGEVRSASNDNRSSVVDDFDIANRQIDKVYMVAGNAYGYAVQRCVRCEFPGRDITKNFNFQEFRQGFFRDVVAPLEARFRNEPKYFYM
ncbi:hypothetical protein F5X96DRAFT_642927 [Biscogniauxia mediterranea]|nr:hypothetical protein F5X96DRAFT_642927 [Biscogniauxia mediterranea]